MRVVITQRVDVVAPYGERRDALDQAWPEALGRLIGAPVQLLPLPNSAGDAAALSPDVLVLSGGNDIGAAAERDATERSALAYARNAGIPVLGVCRGFQMIQHCCGGALGRVEHHAGRPHDISAVSVHAGPPVLTVNSFHDHGIAATALVPELEALYVHADGTVEAARHRMYPWLGIMWHPERAPGGDEAFTWASTLLRALL